MKGLLGIKLGMSQVFDDTGAVTPVTIVQAGPCFVTQVKTEETDGYNAIQVGFGETKNGRLTKGQQGHLGLLKKDKKHPHRKQSNMPALQHLREFRTKTSAEYEVGQELTVEQFEVGDRVDVTDIRGDHDVCRHRLLEFAQHLARVQPAALLRFRLGDHVQAVGVTLVRPVIELRLPHRLFLGNLRHLFNKFRNPCRNLAISKQT